MTIVVKKLIGEKRRWRQYQARKRALPSTYSTAMEALERYLTYYGSIVKGDILVAMLEDLADLFEQSAAAGTPIRALVGENPVEFAEEFVANYSDGQWISKERERLVRAIEAVEREEGR